jgi:antitoxin VapB
MALNIKNAEVERLAAEVAELAGETKTEAIRQALQERRARLAGPPTASGRRERILALLRDEIWPNLPASALGKPSLTKAQRERLLGLGPQGV